MVPTQQIASLMSLPSDQSVSTPRTQLRLGKDSLEVGGRPLGWPVELTIDCVPLTTTQSPKHSTIPSMSNLIQTD